MHKKMVFLNKPLAIGVIFLFFGICVVSSNGNTIKDDCYNTHVLDEVDCSEELLFSGKTAYAYIAYSGGSGLPEGPCCFDLDNPEDIESLAPTQSGDFLTGGTWANGWGWLACQYGNGLLWRINHTNGDMDPIGGGGIGMIDIAWDDWTLTLYGLDGSGHFYEIDPETGEQTQGGGSSFLIGIAFDNSGTCYGIGFNETGYNLYIIEFNPFEAILVGPLVNITSTWSLNIEFDKDNNIFYLLSSNGLYICDTETCECTFVGSTQGIELTAFAIPYDLSNIPPVTTISFNPPYPDGFNGWYISNVTVTLNASDSSSGVKATYYRINGMVWMKYDEPFVLSEDGDDILIEFYSVDNDENVEDVKSATIDIDRTPPELTVEWEVTKLEHKKWQVTFFINSLDNTSGVERLDFIVNDVLIETISYPGQTYNLNFIIEGKASLKFKFLVFNGAGIQAVAVVNRSDIKSFSKSNYNNQYLHLIWHSWLFDRFPFLEVIFSRIISF